MEACLEMLIGRRTEEKTFPDFEEFDVGEGPAAAEVSLEG